MLPLNHAEPWLFSAAIPGPRRAESGPRMIAEEKAYERFMGRWSRLIARPFLDFAAVSENGAVLDAGSGALSFAMAECRPHLRLVGIDRPPSTSPTPTSKTPLPDRAAFEVGDSQQLHFPP